MGTLQNWSFTLGGLEARYRFLSFKDHWAMGTLQNWSFTLSGLEARYRFISFRDHWAMGTLHNWWFTLRAVMENVHDIIFPFRGYLARYKLQ